MIIYDADSGYCEKNDGTDADRIQTAAMIISDLMSEMLRQANVENRELYIWEEAAMKWLKEVPPNVAMNANTYHNLNKKSD